MGWTVTWQNNQLLLLLLHMAVTQTIPFISLMPLMFPVKPASAWYISRHAFVAFLGGPRLPRWNPCEPKEIGIAHSCRFRKVNITWGTSSKSWFSIGNHALKRPCDDSRHQILGPQKFCKLSYNYTSLVFFSSGMIVLEVDKRFWLCGGSTGHTSWAQQFVETSGFWEEAWGDCKMLCVWVWGVMIWHW